jgi:hypothetical protein
MDCAVLVVGGVVLELGIAEGDATAKSLDEAGWRGRLKMDG